MIYDELPGDAFKSSDKKIDVDGKSTDAEKITMHLTEQNVKDILSKLFTKAEKDKKLKNIIKEQYEMQQFGSSFADSSMTGMQSADDLVKDFTDAMKEANKNLKDFHIPDGLTSTIWVKDNTIVKRDFSVKMGPEKDQLVTLKANGTQSLGEKEQKFAYTLGFKDDFSDGKMDIDGTLSNKDGKINDSIKLSVNQFEAVYEADETLKDGKRDFERKITATDKDSQTTGSLTWSGDATYEKDQMNSNNKVSLDGEFLEGAKVAVNLKKSAKTVKEVELPKADQTKDLGTMSVEEIQDYFMNDVAPKAQQYFLQMLGPSW
ncbi:DUF6583 family protein [Virgibacillus sp. 179-BFC.A HS]|uniref:DUF6583 family protein n=1 Tax=Tigheibacillus jepli TaxID=3035914 RepID=A0ABU5CGE1_9BACI|nr:DUF6583 family protein [Virgibacillus sp. 179-BFC.A HS]MDY0405392.1 DUF6583 family protein [Virgibacillus sp. 179-BFC.A HS]